jgi:hypothetical protein
MKKWKNENDLKNRKGRNKDFFKKSKGTVSLWKKKIFLIN